MNVPRFTFAGGGNHLRACIQRHFKGSAGRDSRQGAPVAAGLILASIFLMSFNGWASPHAPDPAALVETSTHPKPTTPAAQPVKVEDETKTATQPTAQQQTEASERELLARRREGRKALTERDNRSHESKDLGAFASRYINGRTHEYNDDNFDANRTLQGGRLKGDKALRRHRHHRPHGL